MNTELYLYKYVHNIFVQIYLHFLLLNWQNKYEEGKKKKHLWASQNIVNRYKRVVHQKKKQ